MVFSSIVFLFVFLPVVLALYYVVPAIRWKNVILLAASIIFYAWGEPVYIVLMLLSILFNFVMGLELERLREDSRRKKLNLIFTVIVNLCILGFFKYYGFLLGSINSAFHLHIPYRELALPVGISFYTFQTLSYILDLYRGDIKVQKNLLDFALYITMFPQLIAGPIVRYVDIQEQLESRVISWHKAGVGAEYFIKGLAKKVLLANTAGAVYTSIQGLGGEYQTVVTSWIGILFYTMQIYFDFSGYSDMAIGLGKMMGFQFCKNFDYPYTSRSVTEFWRRWHISLGTWFREYVYIPLGGNRVSVAKHIRNILVVWALTGLWHGAAWNFVLWGLYYGVFLLLEKYLWGRYLERLPGWVGNLYTMFFVIIGWVFFSNTDLGAGLAYLGSLFGVGVAGFANATTLFYLKSSLLLLVICIVCSRPWAYRWYKRVAGQRPGAAAVINAALLLLSIAFLVYDSYNPFLYFRF
mgnify:FL=1